MRLGAWVLNRVRQERTEPLAAGDELEAGLAVALQTSAASIDEAQQAAQSIARAARLVAGMAEQDAAHGRKLAEQLDAKPQLVTMPRAEVEPASLRELSQLAELLVADASVFGG